jgi:hypothetical protein
MQQNKLIYLQHLPCQYRQNLHVGIKLADRPFDYSCVMRINLNMIKIIQGILFGIALTLQVEASQKKEAPIPLPIPTPAPLVVPK